MIETGVLFNNIHSFYDLGLVLVSAEVSAPSPKETYIDIPGADGSLDLTEVHGEVKYNDRTINLVFAMNPNGNLSADAWEWKKTEVCNKLNGLSCRITLDKDREYYWIGRCKVDSHASNKKVRMFSVTVRVRPYKLKQTETSVSFTLASTAKTVSVINARKSVCPVITCSKANAKVVFNGVTYMLSEGSHQYIDIRLVEGENKFTISGSGNIAFTYQEGDL